MTDRSCVFCAIASGAVPAAIVLETESVVAFRDVNPQAPVHILVIPRLHVESLTDPGAAGVAGSVVEAAARLAAAEGLDSGWRLVANVGPDAGQSVFHLHFHLLGGRRLGWPPG